MTSITPEQFMTQPPEPDEELDASPATDGTDPLTSIADSLRRLADSVDQDREEERTSDALREALADLEDKYRALDALVEEIEGIVKPSTSKLANTVREAVERWRNPEVVPVELIEDEPGPDHPSH